MKYKSSSLVEVPFLVIFTDRLLFCFSFDGRVLAKLPFVPISWFQNLSHRNLPGSDYTHCSFIFIYILCPLHRSVILHCITKTVQYFFCNVLSQMNCNISYFLLIEYSEASWFCSINGSKQTGTWFPHPSTCKKVNL